MNLTIDIGNTLTKAGIFAGEDLIAQIKVKNDDSNELINFITNHQPDKAIFSFTGESNENLKNWLVEKWRAIELNTTTPLPFINQYKTPQTLGKDRIAAVAGAQALYRHQNVLIVDAGTCITFDILTAANIYPGGNIAPGLAMRLKAMHHFTARLPLVIPAELQADVGDSTETAIRNGALLGAILELDGYIRRWKKRYGQLTTVISGGDAGFFVKNLKRKIFVHPDLVLVGLNKILNFNAIQTR